MKQLILGGVRSGKSLYAEKLADDSHLPVTYIATALAGDEEMAARIKAHAERRPQNWALIEEPLYLARTLEKVAEQNKCILIDCLTLWLTNLLIHEDQALLLNERQALLDIMADLPGPLILVSNETNMGIVPMDELSRRYCDEAGHLHQQLAQIFDRVILCVAGLPLVVKGEGL